MLTVKQEKFVQNIIKGMSQREAYRDAYNNNMTDKQCDEEACKLLNQNPKVNQRYRELIDKANDEAIMSAIERKKWLTDVIKGEIKEEDKYYDSEAHEVVIHEKAADISTKIRAMDQLNKMDGIYTTKIEGNLNLSYEEALKSVSDKDDY
jgi:phage terminase small subunit